MNTPLQSLSSTALGNRTTRSSGHRQLFEKVKPLLAALLLTTATASDPGVPPETEGIDEAIVAADIVVLGTPSKVIQRHFHKGREVTKQEAHEIFTSYDSDSEDPFPRLVTEFKVTLQVSTYLKGALRNPELVFRWRDLTGSMCPHIPLRALRDEGIWYTGDHVNKQEHEHAVYWMSPDSKGRVEAAISQAKEKDEAHQPARAVDAKSEGSEKPKAESEPRSQ